MAKEEFKNFVRQNPRLITHVKNGKVSWQQFYEIYDLYGDDENIWRTYLEDANQNVVPSSSSIIELIKNIDLDSVQNSVNSMQRILGLFQDIGSNKEKKTEYKPRPLYKHFED